MSDHADETRVPSQADGDCPCGPDTEAVLRDVRLSLQLLGFDVLDLTIEPDPAASDSPLPPSQPATP